MGYRYSINLRGRVNNFPLPKNNPLLPIYEAIVNSIHAIDEKKKTDASFDEGKIVISAIRETQVQAAGVDDLLPIGSFGIYDNGIGFTDGNMESFLESDSTYKMDLGGKGIGRFSWLKAFNSASITSVYKKDGKSLKREFEFSLDNKTVEGEPVETEIGSGSFTKITLNNYKSDYARDVPKQLSSVATHIIQHFLVYFLDATCPRMDIQDDREIINLNKLFAENFKIEESSDNFNINGVEFNLLHAKIENQQFLNKNQLHFYANNRLVENNKLENAIVDLDNRFFSRNKFWYFGILTSNYFNDNVNMNRLSLDIPKEDSDLTKTVSSKEILNESCEKIKQYLREYLTPISEEKISYIKEYITKKAPQYKHLPKYMPDDMLNIKPHLNDDELSDALYNIKRKFDKISQKEQKELFEKIEKSDMSLAENEKYLESQFDKIIDANNAELAQYVIHRRVIIELLDRGLYRQEDGKFNKEKYIHNLIYPMKTSSDDLELEKHNLWLIDEKLSYCQYISSDMPLNTKDRPDILVADKPIAMSNAKNDGTAFDTIIIFELKRPMRDDYTDSDNPIMQLRNYVGKFRNKEIKDQNGRYVNVNETTKYYLYAICDITPSLDKAIVENGFIPTPDALGYYWYNPRQNAYYEILSYDKLLNDAKQRNRILFDKLGIE